VKFRIFLLAAMTMLLDGAGMAQPAVTAATTAVTPILSGTYIFEVTHICQVVIQTPMSNGSVTGVNATNSGDLEHNVGTIAFDHTTSKVTLSADLTGGSPILLNGTGTTFGDTASSQTVTYANTANSFSFNGHSFHAFYANVNSSTKIPQFMMFSGIEKSGCSISGIAIHQ
jgi:hypothetical protein